MKFKKLLTTLGFITSASVMFAQTANPSVVNRSSEVVTVQDDRLDAKHNFGLPRYADTTAANIWKGNDSCGRLIFTYDSNQVWKRACSPKRWQSIATGGSAGAGATGPAGSNGTNGTNGVDGATWRSGSGVPSDGLGVNNDFYLNTSNGDVYKKTAGTYSVITNITGPTGSVGATGSTGPAGAIPDTATMLDPYLRKVDALTLAITNALYSAIGHTHTFGSLTSKPTTLAGYNITDAYPLTGNPSGFISSYSETDPVWIAQKSGYLTTAAAAAAYSVLAHTHSFASLTSPPTTIGGYGITDFNSLGDARWSLLAHSHAYSSLTGLPSLFDKTVSNTFGTGQTQVFQGDATNAGIRFGGVTATPSNLVAGMWWYRGDLGTMHYYDGFAGSVRTVVNLAGAQTLVNKTLTAPVITSPTGIVKADVGLSLVDNTDDASKPVSTAQAAAIALKVTKNAWIDYAATSTITGWANVYTVKQLQYVINGNFAIVQYEFTGTGSGTVTTFTLPFSASSWSGTTYAPARTLNNSTWSTGSATITAGSSTVNIAMNPNGATFTTGVARNVAGTIIISL